MNFLHETVFWILLAVSWWWFYWLHRRYWVDKTRQRLFLIRDNLFNAAARGSAICFDDRAYGMTRVTINGMLRTLEDYNALRALGLLLRYKYSLGLRDMCARYLNSNNKSIKDLTPDGRDLIKDTMNKANKAFIDYLIHTSLLLWTITNLFGPIYRVISSPFPHKYWEHVSDALDMETNIVGHDDELPTYLTASP